MSEPSHKSTWTTLCKLINWLWRYRSSDRYVFLAKQRLFLLAWRCPLVRDISFRDYLYASFLPGCYPFTVGVFCLKCWPWQTIKWSFQLNAVLKQYFLTCINLPVSPVQLDIWQLAGTKLRISSCIKSLTRSQIRRTWTDLDVEHSYILSYSY